MIFSLESPSLHKARTISPKEGERLPVHLPEQLPFIPKPPGEFNRPSNGYTLEDMCKDRFGWDEELWVQVQVSSR